MKHLKWSVANKISQIVNIKTFFNVNNVESFNKVTSFIKFDMYGYY